MPSLFSADLEYIIGFAAGLLISFAQLMLIRDVYAGRMRARILSWIGWGLLIGIGCIAQWVDAGWEQSMIGMAASTIGCFVVSGVALFRKHYAIARADYFYVVLGLICMGLYFTFKDPLLTIVFAVHADFIVGWPTIKAAYHHPISQRSVGWMIGGISWTLTLIICIGHDWLYAIFPAYLWMYNWGMVLLSHRTVHAEQQR